MIGMSPIAAVGAIPLHQGDAVHARHDQILEDDRRLEALDDLNRFCGVAAIMKIHIGLVGEHAPDGLADRGLVVHQQHHVDMFVRWRRHRRPRIV